MKPKKWILSEQKLSTFQEGDKYTICCYVSDCPCKAESATCPRGFFSLFLQALYGIDLAHRYNLKYYIDFGNHKYLYTEPTIEDCNLWNYYFQQPYTGKLPTNHLVRNTLNEVYPLRIWRRKHFLRLNKAVSKIHFREEIERKLLVKKEFFNAHKILGVQIRRTDHGQEIEHVPIMRFLDEIDQRLYKYDYLFVSTDDNITLDFLRNRYGGKLIVNEVHRSDNEEAIHTNTQVLDRYKLGEEAIMDCYCLSLCKYAILIQSNISYSAVVFNPKLPYTLLELTSIKGKIKKGIHSLLDTIQSLLER